MSRHGAKPARQLPPKSPAPARAAARARTDRARHWRRRRRAHWPCRSARASAHASGSSDQNASNTLRRATVAASGSVPPVSALRQRDDVGHDAGLLAGEHRAGAAEAGEDLVEDQQQIVAVGEPRAGAAAPPASWNSMPPAPCTSGSTMMPAMLVGMALEQLRQARRRSPRPSADRRRDAPAAARGTCRACRRPDRSPPSRRWCRRDSRP